MSKRILARRVALPAPAQAQKSRRDSRARKSRSGAGRTGAAGFFLMPASGRPSRSTGRGGTGIVKGAPGGAPWGTVTSKRPPVRERHAEDRARAQARRDMDQ